MPRRPFPIPRPALEEARRLRSPAPPEEPASYRAIARQLHARRLTKTVIDPRILWRALKRGQGAGAVALVVLAALFGGACDDPHLSITIERARRPDAAEYGPRPEVCPAAKPGDLVDPVQVVEYCRATFGGRVCAACTWPDGGEVCALTENIACTRSCSACDRDGGAP